MSSAGISFGGLSSGLDTKAIVSALVGVERVPIQAMQAKQSVYSKQKSLFGDLSKMLQDLRTKAQALRKTTDFLAMKASSDKESSVTASASSTATPGSYQVEVEALAQAQVNSSHGLANRTTDYGADALLFTYGGVPHPVNVHGTIDQIAEDINGAGLDITAEVVDTGSPTDPYQLVLRSKTTGADGAFTVTTDSGSSPALDALITDIDGHAVTDAQNAHILFNGIDVYRTSNSIGDLIGGVTLQLKAKTTTGEPATIAVSPDAEATSAQVKDFVEAYNKIVDFVQAQFAVDGKGTASGPLFGDNTLRSVRSSLRSIMGSPVGTGNNAYSMFAQIGITSDTQGKLTFNQSKFEEALLADETAVSNLFTDSSNGIANRVYAQIDVYTSTVDGLIKSRTDGLDRMTKDTQSRIDQAERRLTKYQSRLEAQYANLETLMSRLQSQGSSLSSINNL